MFGLCHTINYKRKVGKLSEGLMIHFKRNNDLNIFINEPGNEFWLKRAYFPMPVNKIRMPLKSNRDICNGDLTLKKKQFKMLDKKSRPCKDYEFTACAMVAMSKTMKSEGINCLIPLWNEFQTFGVPICPSLNLSTANILKPRLDKINSDFLKKPEQYGCPNLCTTTNYNPQVIHFDESMKATQTEEEYKCQSEYMLNIYYTTDPVEITKEYFVYDAMTIISAIGGTLGLLLGYSILSMCLSLISLAE